MTDAPHPQLEAPDYIVLAVADLDAAVDFWTGVLGLRLDHRSDPFVQLDTGPTRICLYQREAFAATTNQALAPDAARARPFEIGFKVADVDSAWQALVEAGAEPVCAPTDRPWGQRTAYVSDPDGHLVEIAQPIEG